MTPQVEQIIDLSMSTQICALLGILYGYTQTTGGNYVHTDLTQINLQETLKTV